MVSIPQTGPRGIRKETGGYKPSKIVRQAHFHPARTKLVAGGIRGMKSMSEAMECLSWLPHTDLSWLAGKSYDDCRQEFEYIMEAAISLGWTDNRLVSFPQNKYSPCSLETYWGSLVETKSADDPGSLMSRAPGFIGFCEPGKMDIAAFRRANERISTSRGMIWMGGTFEESGQWFEDYWRLWARWPNEYNAKSWTVPSWTNTAVYSKGLHDPEIEKLRHDAENYDQFLRRIAGVPASQPDIIFSSTWKPRQHVGIVELERRVADQPGTYQNVYAAIDPGYSGESRYIVLAIQVKGNKIRVIDEICERRKTHQEIKAVAMVRPWWPYMHTGTIDPHAGDSHALGSVSPIEVWRTGDVGGEVLLENPKQIPVDDLIRLIQSYLNGTSGFTVEVSDRCVRLRDEMSRWKRIRNKTNGLGDPQKSNCDAIKALGYFLTHHYNGRVGKTNSAVKVSNYSLTGSLGVDPVLNMVQEAANQNMHSEIW